MLQVVDICKSNGIGLVLVGPEAPLVAGPADDLSAASIRTFRPSAAAAQLEGSKRFMQVYDTAWSRLSWVACLI